jgi:hypothetical protein
VQLICARGRDALLLDLAEDLEESLAVDVSAMQRRLPSDRAAQAVT